LLVEEEEESEEEEELVEEPSALTHWLALKLLGLSANTTSVH
jgi:hypothetical protein